jgi:hypothetical protein
MIITADAAWCEQVCRFLEVRGHTVIAASTKQVALQALAECDAPSAVLADPETADRTFCQMLNARPELCDSRVFLVSAAPARGVYEKGVGISGYLRKAVALDYLMLLLEDETGTSHSGGGASAGRAA